MVGKRAIDLIEGGISILETALILPMLIVVMVAVYDLSNIFLTAMFAQEVVGTVIKIASSTSPNSYAPPASSIAGAVTGAEAFVKPVSGEPSAVTSHRRKFWADQVTAGALSYHGKTYFTNKELGIFNLGSQLMVDLDPNIYFPIPTSISGVSDLANLGGRTNCSLSFTYTAADVPPAPLSPPSSPYSTFELNRERDRIYRVDCRIPLIVLNLFGWALGSDYFSISREAYAYQSGSISP